MYIVNETVVIALIGLFGTIFLPILTYYLTSRGTTKKAEAEKKELEEKNTEMILKINEQHKNDLEKNEKGNQYAIFTRVYRCNNNSCSTSINFF